MKKRLFTMLLSVAITASLFTGCGKRDDTTSNHLKDKYMTDDTSDSAKIKSSEKLIGVTMPTKDLQRWNQDGDNIKKGLEAAGYEVDIRYASYDTPTQIEQIWEMIANDCKVLVIASADSYALGSVLAEAKNKEIPVIAYDRLLMNTDAVSYYAAFDNYMVGKLQGEYIKNELSLDESKETYYMEIFGGDASDNNTEFLYNGAMEILQPYIDSGKLVIKSGQKDLAMVTTANWRTEAAKSRMQNILHSFYSDGTTLDAVLCANDSTALGVITALEEEYAGKWPVIVGQDCDKANMKKILEGKQSMSVFKDTRNLADSVVSMVDAIMRGTEVPVNDLKSYNNGIETIPSYLCTPETVTNENYDKLIIESGYYTMDDIQ